MNRIKLLKKISGAIFISLATTACELGSPFYFFSSTPVESRATTIKVLEGGDIPEVGTNSKYSFLIITDTHFCTKLVDRHDEEFLQKFEELLSVSDETLKPRFIINLGDTLNAGQKKGAEQFHENSAKWIQKAKDKLGVSEYKIYSILGNHDLYNDGWEIWKENFWPHTSYYKFSVKANSQEFSFYFLDSGNGTLGAPQIFDLEENLKADSNPKIVLCHYPLYAKGQSYFTFNDARERNRLISLYLKHNVKKVFEGHFHPSNYSDDFGKFTEVVAASYVYKRNVTLVTVDETNETVEHKFISY